MTEYPAIVMADALKCRFDGRFKRLCLIGSHRDVVQYFKRADALFHLLLEGFRQLSLSLFALRQRSFRSLSFADIYKCDNDAGDVIVLRPIRIDAPEVCTTITTTDFVLDG